MIGEEKEEFKEHEELLSFGEAVDILYKLSQSKEKWKILTSLLRTLLLSVEADTLINTPPSTQPVLSTTKKDV